MIGDISHQMVIDTFNEVDIHTVDRVCDHMGVEVTIEDGRISDYDFKENE